MSMQLANSKLLEVAGEWELWRAKTHGKYSVDK